MGSNQDKVFALPESLEAVILQLSPKDLLLAQRVEETWFLAIQNSIKLQRKLFYKAILPTSIAAQYEPEINPFFETILKRIACDAVIYDTRLREDCMTEPDCEGYALDKTDKKFHIQVATCQDIDQDIQRLPGGSWHNMLVANPPCPVQFRESCIEVHRGECLAETIGELADCMVICAAWGHIDDTPRSGLDFIGKVPLGIKSGVSNRIRAST